MLKKKFINPTLSYLKILLVSEEEFDLTLFSRKLEGQDHNILFAKSRQEALEILKTENRKSVPVDLVVTEYTVADVDGFEILKEAMRLGPEIMTAFYTGSRIDEIARDIQERNGCSVDGIIHKADNTDRLRYFISSVLETKKARHEKNRAEKV